MTDKTPSISIIIPIHNEEGILLSAVHDLLMRLPALDRSFELILAENGSNDRTIAIAEELSTKYPEVSTFSAPEPNYGIALRMGIERARGKYVLCDEVDICDVNFYWRALELLEKDEADMVVGSKAMPGSNDKRPLGRRMATSVMNGLLKMLLDFQGTDTHGLKAFNREKLLWAVQACVVDRDVFASELVIRAGRGETRVTEIPVNIVEKRPPSVDLVRRVPAVLKGLGRLFLAIRFGV
ncbi:MAG: glycosyltransferase family 2 protein [Deltaproteobacteria bacterium]|nr:glycosyltransferase family 2 protein [Deltaproteobacteria bacterium]